MPDQSSHVTMVVDGETVDVVDEGRSLLDALREQVGALSVKDGCSPQGQCGCCTVLVDGAPRVACVTPLRRMSGRTITTVDGIDDERRSEWAEAFASTGASQCGFCSPGIICRLEGLALRGGDLTDDGAVGRALQAHLCRCTGWAPIREAAVVVASGVRRTIGRNDEAAATRAMIEGGAEQLVGPLVALGQGGFADDTAPIDSLVAVPDGDSWVVADSLFEARSRVQKIQGRRTTLASAAPIDLPPGDWAAAIQTSWVEPAYLETDTVWCVPGEDAVGPLLNGGAFGAKTASPLRDAARMLADEYQRPVKVVTDREWSVRNGPKRPPFAGGLRRDGSGIIRVASTPGIVDIIRGRAGEVEIVEVDVVGPPTSAAVRAAGWAEMEILLAGLAGVAGTVVAPGGGEARAEIGEDGVVRVVVRGGDVLDEVVLRSYVTGAAHMALGWIRSESLAVDDAGVVHDLTIRSFGVLRAIDTPRVEVEIDVTSGPPVNVSDASFAAVAAAAWLEAGMPSRIPAGSR